MAISDLLEAAAVLGFLALIALPKDEFSGSEMWRAVRQSLCSLSLTMAVAAVLGAALLWSLPIMLAQGLDDLTLAGLNDRIEQSSHWLQRAWLLPFTVGAWLLGLALAGFGAISGVRARRVGASLGWALKVKALAAILACFCFTAAGLQHRAQGLNDAAQTLKQALPSLRIELATAATRQAAAVLSEALVAGAPATGPWQTTARAYWIAQPYLLAPASPVPWQGTARLATQAASALPDLSTKQLRSIATSMRQEQGVGASDTQRLAAVLMEATVDPAVAEPARKALLAIDNPLIDEMVAALLDPVVARPLRQWVFELTVAGVAASGDGAAMRRWAQHRWNQAPPNLMQRLQRAVRRASLPSSPDRADLGQPQWQSARKAMRASVNQSLGRREVVSGLDALSAQRAIASFDNLWESLDTLLQSPQARKDAAEAAAARYLLSTQDRRDKAAVYAALWGATLARQMPASLFGEAGPSMQPTARDGLKLYFSRQPADVRYSAARQYFPVASTSATASGHESRVRQGVRGKK